MMEEYPEYNVLDRKEYWDTYTREIIEKRISEIPTPRFFSAGETAVLEAAMARVLPQDREYPIAITPFIDEKLANNRTDGTQYEDMPTMGDIWRIFIRALDEEAEAREKKSFEKLDADAQDQILEALAAGMSSSESWANIPAERVFQYIVSTAAAFYYSHPYAWNEIGWGGPKYPEIYVRIACGIKDPEEAGRVGHVREQG